MSGTVATAAAPTTWRQRARKPRRDWLARVATLSAARPICLNMLNLLYKRNGFGNHGIRDLDIDRGLGHIFGSVSWVVVIRLVQDIAEVLRRARHAARGNHAPLVDEEGERSGKNFIALGQAEPILNRDGKARLMLRDPL